VRRSAKAAMAYPEVVLNGHQALNVGRGFAGMVAKSQYVVHACSILPEHTHMVIVRHSYSIEQVVRLLRQAATTQLLKDGRHPFVRGADGRLPSVWAQDFWKVFLFTEDDIAREIDYVEQNPVKEGKPRQTWPFVTPFGVSDASQKR